MPSVEPPDRGIGYQPMVTYAATFDGCTPVESARNDGRRLYLMKDRWRSCYLARVRANAAAYRGHGLVAHATLRLATGATAA